MRSLTLPKGWSRSHAASADAMCDSCPFWRRPHLYDPDREHGECRRRPPRDDGSWPPADADEWCGEHPGMAGAPAGVWHDDDSEPVGGEYLWKAREL